MRRKLLGSLGVVVLAACAHGPEAHSPPAPAQLPSSEPPPPVPAAAPAPPPSPEEQKKAEEQKQLEKDYAKLRADHAAELARLTPELRTAAKAVAEKTYANGGAAISAAVAGPHRKPSNAERDGARHARETLELFGFKPTQTVLEYGPGEGWYTELLAPALAKNGKLFVTITDPAGPPSERPTFYGQRTKLFLERLPEVYSKVETVTIDPKAPKLPFEGQLDLVLVNRGAHGMHNNKVLRAWLAEFHRALKPRGVLGIEQHRALPGTHPDETSKKGYLPEAFVISEVEMAGFKLVTKSELNANPKDTKDHPEGVWTLPPTLRLGDKDREKYLAIGESDRMTLRFVKAAKPMATTTKLSSP